MGEYKKTVIVDSMSNEEILELLEDDVVFCSIRLMKT